MHVIFNADDFGLTKGVNHGIAEACQSGVVRSTTLMVGMEAVNHAVELASSLPSLKVGVHLRFTAGTPLTDATSLVGDNGQFVKQEVFWPKSDFSEQQVADEVVAQVESFLASGLSLSHLDSHHHAHTHSKILPVVQDIARNYQVPLRASGFVGKTANDCRYAFDDGFYGEDISQEKLLHIIKKHHGSCDVLEIMTHPAYVDQALINTSAYNVIRAKELEILTEPALFEALDALGVTIGDYSILSS